MDLGIRFEEGNGVRGDLGKAESLHRLAASESLKEIEFYQPGTSRMSGKMVKLKSGQAENGLSEAVQRLQRLLEKLKSGDRSVEKENQ